MVVVVVEPGLADGHYRRIGQRRFDARRGVRVPGRGDVGMDAGRGRKSEGVRQFYGTPGGLEGIRDDDDVSHARVPARRSTSSRSGSNAVSARWQWVSTSIRRLGVPRSCRRRQGAAGPGDVSGPPRGTMARAPRASSPGQRRSMASRMGDAMKMDENVPTTMPNVMTQAKPRITSLPTASRAMVAANVVLPVITVRGSVSLRLRLISSTM